MSTKKFLIISIAAILGSTVFNYASLGDMSKYQRSSSPSSRSFGGEGGVTGVLLLAESHLSIHTWPEHGFAAIDIFLCGRLRPEAAKDTLQHALKAERSVWQTHPRGSEL